MADAAGGRRPPTADARYSGLEMSRTPTDAGGSFNPDDSEAEYGGADAVEKTTYVTGHGTEPETRSPGHPKPLARSDGWSSWAVWAVAAALLLLTLVYGISLLL